MAKAREKKKMGTEETIEGIFRTVGSFLDILSDMVQKGEIPIRRKRDTEYGERKGMKAAAIYGFSVSLGDPGSGAQPFLEVRSHEDKGLLTEEAHEPEEDFLDDKETVVVVAELPGTSGKDITVEVRRYPNNHV